MIMGIALVIRYAELGEPEAALLHLGDGVAESRAAFAQQDAATLPASWGSCLPLPSGPRPGDIGQREQVQAAEQEEGEGQQG